MFQMEQENPMKKTGMPLFVGGKQNMHENEENGVIQNRQVSKVQTQYPEGISITVFSSQGLPKENVLLEIIKKCIVIQLNISLVNQPL